MIQRSILPKIFLLVSLAATFIGAIDAHAQVNTSGIRGTVTAGDDGTKLGYVEVTLIHKPSGNTKSTFTNESGAFAFNGLRVGGPYSIKVFMEGFLPQGADGIYLSAGKKENFPFVLPVAGETIQVTGSAAKATTSDKRVFDDKTIQELPSIGRDPKDIARLSPDAIIDDSNSDAISIGGANNRFNSVTIDGIRQDDDFGLNAGGFPTRRSPVSLAAIEEVAVETSPFDVRYGKFLGGNINIVTKSGTNDFHGNLFAAYTDENFTGTRTGPERRTGDFREARYGLSLGGPIVKDKVHFFASVEGLSATTPTDIGVLGSGAAIEVTDITAAELAQVQEITRRVYGFEPGQPDCDANGRCRTQSLDEDDLKLLVKLDWAINEKHRATAKYQRTTGNEIRQQFSSARRLTLTSNWYNATDTLNAFNAQLFSDWTDNFSTEIEFSGKIVDNRQAPLNGADFAQVTIDGADKDGDGIADGEIRLGPDRFRHANKLDNNLFHFKTQANYLFSNHQLTAGWELDLFSVNNLFVQRSLGDVDYDSIADFEALAPSRFRYNNSITGNANDARADWGYSTHAVYLQDQFDPTPNLTFQAGVRGEIYQTGSDVVQNDNFEIRNGFLNTATIDNKFLVMPRAGASWRAIPRLNLRGGVGLYGGGTPNVWLSNSYTNDGVRVASADSRVAAELAGFNGRDIPDAIVQQQIMNVNGNVDALDPDFSLPSTWKASLGADYTFDIPKVGPIGYDFEVKANYVYSRVNRGVTWQDLRRDSDLFPNNQPVGTLPDGRPYYDNTCVAGDATSCFNPERGYDLFLTNVNGGSIHSATLSLAKSIGPLSLSGSYAFQRATDVNPATSSTSASNYGRVAVVDPQNLTVATSNYERAHRLVGILQLSGKPFKNHKGLFASYVNDLSTNLALFWESRSGQPFSYTYDGNDDDLGRLFGEEAEFADRNRNLFYVPDGSGNDVILDGIDENEFNNVLEQTGLSKYRGQIAPRNAFRSPWFHKLDMRFSQELPSPIKGHKGKFILDIENVGNLLSSKWGRFEQVNFPYVAPLVDVNVDPATGQYIYSDLRTTDDLVRVNIPASIWRIQMTLMYDF